MSHHKVERFLPYAQEQLFDLVADVKRYPEFVPWWVMATIWKRQDNVYYTRQILGMPLLRQEIQSKTTLNRPEHISINSTDRPFKTLDMDWRFTPCADGGTLVRLDVDFAFRSLRYEMLGGIISGESIRRLVDAFEGRALQLLEQPSSPPSRALTGAHQMQRETLPGRTPPLGSVRPGRPPVARLHARALPAGA